MRMKLRAATALCALVAGTAAMAAPADTAVASDAAEPAATASTSAPDQAPPPPRDNASGAGSSQDIVVTAQLRSQRLLDVPLSVQAFSGQQLQDSGYRDLRQIVTLVPGASEGRGNAAGIRSYQIRGVASFYGDSTVGYYLDDAAYVIPNRNYAPVSRSFDVDRVEVLRGPQGTLYGLGSMGGTIRFITSDPDLNAFHARGDAGISDTGEGGQTNYYGDAAVTVPIIPGHLAVRGVASYERLGGYAQAPNYPGDWNNDTFQNYRVKLLAQPTDNLSIRLSYNRNDTSDDWGQNLATTDPAAYPRSPVPGRNHQVYDMYTGHIRFDAGPVVLESSTGYVDRRDRSVGPIVLGPAPAFELDVASDSTSFVQEVRAVSQNEGPLQWVIGGIYIDASNREDIKVVRGPPISSVSQYDSKSWAGFGEVSLGLFNDTLRPLVGLRYFHDNRDFFTQNRAPFLAPALNTSGDFTSTNPRFNLSWQPNRSVNVYVNVARGFRSGTFNTASAVALSGGQVGYAVAPDNIWSYEAGAKINTADRRWYFELTGYRMDWSNVQLNYTVAGGVQVIRNAGDVRGSGFEFVVNWNPLPGFTVNASGNINSTKFRTIVNPALFLSTPNIAVGRQLASVPRSTFNIGATYDHPTGWNDTSLFVTAQYTFINREGDPGDNLARMGGQHNLVRARAGLRWPRFGVFLYGENLLDDTSPIIVSGSGRTRYYPRVLGVELNFNY